MNEGTKVTSLFPARRLLVVMVFLLCASTLGWRVVDLQLNEKDFLQGHGADRYLRINQIQSDRGIVFDRNGEALAISIPSASVWAEPKVLMKNRERWIELADAINMPLGHLEALVTGRLNRNFVYLRRQLTPEQSRRVAELDLSGVSLQEDSRRYYPSAEVTSHVVGFTNVDDQGQEGVELEFDESLSAVPGLRRVIKDRLGRVIEELEELRERKKGEPIHLSIDDRVQYAAYRALKTAVHRHAARAGSMVILDVRTGEILALVNQPSFNPNNRSGLKPENLRNRAVTDLFEPGSTAKPFTIAAALESSHYDKESIVDTAPGLLEIGQHSVTDIENFGNLNLTNILVKSSNVGASKIALSLEPRFLWNVFQSVGLGTSTEVALPGEIIGRLKHYSHWRDIEHATQSFGYGLSLNVIQLARAYAVIANGGWLQKLSIKKLETPGHRERVLKRETTEELLGMLTRVVDSGTGKKGQVRGYSVAGKTGTVHKNTTSGYASNRYLSLFAGIIPATDPELVAVVVVDEPRKGEYFGGRVAAPVFASAMSDAVRLLDIRPDRPFEDSYTKVVAIDESWIGTPSGAYP
jgi:cell division protein FtsI (penicillin-binding protein 3)